ncbi:MAG: ATPase, T2SS/T4P/T4SS family [Patescibacteria group bacterium]|jgi:type II secretory ATPase GspE/PulE/Tfp pilus assembly ATPase PilB-like protein
MKKNIENGKRKFMTNEAKFSLTYYEDLSKISINHDVINKISPDQAVKYQIIPINYKDGKLTLITADGNNFKLQNELEKKFGPITLKITTPQNLEAGINRIYDDGYKFEQRDALKDFETQQTNTKAAASSDLAQMVDAIIRDAALKNASDIHIIPTEKDTRVMFRIHGKFLNVTDIHHIKSGSHEKVVNRIKTMCKPSLDISKKEIFQDGSFSVSLDENNNNNFHCRVNVGPTALKNEGIVIRIHDSKKAAKKPDELGFTKEDLIWLKKLLKVSAGMILIAGPTSSGKSTTIQSLLSEYNADEFKYKIVTAEDPVEVKCSDGTIIQTEIKKAENEAVSIGYADIIKAFLRQDPDIIMVGEIRDNLVATAALQAAETGHVLYSTVHANSASATMGRMFNMGIEKFDLLQNIACIIAQRLIATNCEYCAEPHILTEDEKQWLTPQEIEDLKSGTLKSSTGCEKCNYKGVGGRIVVAEFIPFNNKIRDYFMQEHSATEVLKFLQTEAGFISMWEKGIEHAKSGKITIAELGEALGDERIIAASL